MRYFNPIKNTFFNVFTSKKTKDVTFGAADIFTVSYLLYLPDGLQTIIILMAISD